MPASSAQASMAALAQAGIGTVRVRLPFPFRSQITHRPSRCVTLSNDSWACALVSQFRDR